MTRKPTVAALRPKASDAGPASSCATAKPAKYTESDILIALSVVPNAWTSSGMAGV